MSRLGLIAILVLLACAAMSSAAVADSIVVTRDSLRLPSGCSPREVGELVSRFTEAVNTDDEAALSRLFVTNDPPGRALEPAGKAFRWYSVTEGRSGASQPWRHRAYYDRSELFAYFAERHDRNERLALVEVKAGASSHPQAVGLEFKVRREADDLPSWLDPFAYGKAGIDCAEQAIYLWSMGQNDRDFLRQVCPRPPGWRPGAPAVACSRGPNAPTLAPEFRIPSTRVPLPSRCRPTTVRRTVSRALAAFNVGLGDEFARRFVVRGQFHPYTGSIAGSGFVGRKAIARFVRGRYRAGDGWTATRLIAPRGPAGLPEGAVYGLDFRVTYQGAVFAEAVSSKLVVDCRSGLVARWVGPSLKTPPVRD